MILVVGATGQLGTAVVRKLVAAGRPVRAFVRQDSHHAHLAGLPVELAVGDLRNFASVAAACTGVDAVIATANSVIRRPGDTFAAVVAPSPVGRRAEQYHGHELDDGQCGQRLQPD